MTDLTAYRSRVTTVRGRARAQLAAIRKERLSRRNQARHVTETALPMAPVAAEAVEQHDVPADALIRSMDAAIGLVEETAEDTVPDQDPAPADPEMAAGLEHVEPVADDAAGDASAAVEAEEHAFTDVDDAAPADPEAGTVPVDAAEFAAAPVAELAPEPDENIASQGPAPVAEEAQCEDPATELAGEPGHADADVLPLDIAPEDQGAAQEMETGKPGDAGPLMLGASLLTSACGMTDAPEVAAPLSEPAASSAEPVVDASQGPRPEEAAQEAAGATLQEDIPEAAEDAAPLAAADPEDVAAPSDLYRIPGIGTGLVWMMQSAGIQCLDDLARAETRDLEARLGMISRLLDLDYFVEFARTRDATP